jgi:hypothetical protein
MYPYWFYPWSLTSGPMSTSAATRTLTEVKITDMVLELPVGGQKRTMPAISCSRGGPTGTIRTSASRGI